MKSILILATLLVAVNARVILPAGFVPGPQGSVYPTLGRPQPKPAVIVPTNKLPVLEEVAPEPCDSGAVGVIVHPQEPIYVNEDVEEIVEEDQPCDPNTIEVVVHPNQGSSGGAYPIIVNRPTQTRPSITPVGPAIQQPSITPLGPQQQVRPAVLPTYIPQQRPSITPIGPQQQVRPAVLPTYIPQQRPSITPVGPQIRPAVLPAVPQPCVVAPEEVELQRPSVVPVGPTGQQPRPQVLPAILPQPVAVIQESDGSYRPVYDYIR